MAILHHPDDATLMSFAAGSLPNALSAVVATHVTMCPHCAGELRMLDAIGSSLLEDLAPIPAGRAPLMALRAAEADVGMADAVDRRWSATRARLAELFGRGLDEVPFSRSGPGIWLYTVELDEPSSGKLQIVKVAPGQMLPEHGHGGSELTLLLQGAYRDKTGYYATGDIADLDAETEHQPVADAEYGCICLTATDRRLNFKSIAARLAQTFNRF